MDLPLFRVWLSDVNEVLYKRFFTEGSHNDRFMGPLRRGMDVGQNLASYGNLFTLWPMKFKEIRKWTRQKIQET
jgi:hypothetical protein